MVEGGGLENRCTGLPGPWVRIPPSPPEKYRVKKKLPKAASFFYELVLLYFNKYVGKTKVCRVAEKERI